MPVKFCGLSGTLANVLNQCVPRRNNRVHIARNNDDYEDFIEELESCIKNSRNERSISIRGKSEGMLTYDPIIHSHWRTFARHLSRSGSTGIVSLSINNVELSTALLEPILPALKTNKIVKMDFKNTNIFQDGASFLGTILESNKSVKELILDENPIHCWVSLKKFSNELKWHQGIEAISLQNCRLGGNECALSSVLDAVRGKAVCINLSNNRLQSRGTKLVADLIRSNCRSKTIILSNNGLKDEDAFSFARALRKNTNLRRLVLTENNFTNIGENELVKSIFDDGRLTAVANSNHICQLDLGPDMKFLEEINDHKTSRINERKKVLIAIKLATCNGYKINRYFDRVPLELMPNALEILQWQLKGDDRSLSKTYDVLRNWKLPLLYSFVSPVRV